VTKVAEPELRITRYHVVPKGESLFSELATLVEIEDLAGGEYVKVTQQSTSRQASGQEITIEPEEWPRLREAIDRMIAACQPEKAT
jgi:hypothetical protein